MGFSSRHPDGQRLYLTRLIYSIFKEHDTVVSRVRPGDCTPAMALLGAHCHLNQGGQVDQKINEGDKAL